MHLRAGLAAIALLGCCIGSGSAQSFGWSCQPKCLDSAVRWDSRTHYVFKGSEYVAYAGEKPEDGYPRSIQRDWKGLKGEFASGIDAVLNWGNGTLYFFKGDQYIRYVLSPDGSPAAYDQRSIAAGWSFPETWRSGINGAINWGNGKVYFFRGPDYLRYDIATQKVDRAPGPISAGQWPGFPRSWSGGIDAAFNWGEDRIYFFKGQEYLRYTLRKDGTVTSSGVLPVQGNWTIFQEASRRKPSEKLDNGGVGNAAIGPSSPQRRVALVIGNGAYLGMPRLRNPANDASDMAAQLKALGFEVTLGIDLARNPFEEMLIRFAREARQSEVALIFYAGHGVQHNGLNYLVPVDARIEDEADLRRLVQLQSVLEDLRASKGVRILILDACRDNDVVHRMATVSPTRSAAFDRGLSRLDRDSARGAFIVYATQPNVVAKDGDGRNSPFTSALLKHMSTPGLELRNVMTRVRADVVHASGGAQWPEVVDSLIGELVMKATP